MKSKKKLSYSLMALATILFGFSFLASKTALNALNNDVIAMLSYRFIFSMGVMMILRFSGIIKVDFKGKKIKPLLLLVLFSPLLTFAADSTALTMISSFEAGLFVAIIPVFSILFGYLYFKETIAGLRAVFMVVSIIGVLIINIFGYTPGGSNNLGRLLMMVMALSAALYLVYSRKASSTFTPTEVTWSMMLAGAVGFTAMAVVKAALTDGFGSYFSAVTNSSFIIAVLYLAIGSSVGAYFCLNYAIPRLNVAAVAVFANITPIVAIFAGVVFLNEQIYWYHILGSVVIITGVLGASLLGDKQKNVKEAIKAEQA